jgi:hypothetical protein
MDSTASDLSEMPEPKPNFEKPLSIGRRLCYLSCLI